MDKVKVLKEAANICERMVVGGRAWTHDQEVAADALMAAARTIRDYAESGAVDLDHYLLAGPQTG